MWVPACLYSCVVSVLSVDGEGHPLLFFLFVSLAPSLLPASLYLWNRSFRQTDWKRLDLRWTKQAGRGGGGLVPLQDNYNLVAATATLSPTSLPTHTHILLIGRESRCGNNSAGFSVAPMRPRSIVKPREVTAVRLEENGESLKSFNEQQRVVWTFTKNLNEDVCDFNEGL